jgi:hypothetical protein
VALDKSIHLLKGHIVDVLVPDTGL